MRRRVGAGTMAVSLLLTALSVSAAEAPRGRYASQLARECDELLSWTVKRPYGWAWAEGAPEARPKGGAQVVDMEPGATAGAVFVLYWAGDLLDEARYKEAAYQGARGLVAAQRPTGQVAGRPLFQPSAAGGHGGPALVADRGPSRAAVAALLTLYDEGGSKDEFLRRGASRTLGWLLKQQAVTGAWPQGYPPATAPKDAARLTRFDTPDYRDTTFAMLLASDVLGEEATLKLSVEKALEFVIRARIGGASKRAGALWATAYGLEAFPTNRVADYPPGVDVVASRNAMQVLVAAYVVRGGDPPARGEVKVSWSEPLRAAAAAVEGLPKFGGKWMRIYSYDVEATPPPPPPPQTIFGAPTTAPATTEPSRVLGTFGMDRTAELVRAVDDVGLEKVRAALMANLTLRQRLAASACGVDDEAFMAELPVTDEEVAEYLKRNAAKFVALEGPLPESVPERVRRVYLLWVRATLERREAGRTN